MPLPQPTCGCRSDTPCVISCRHGRNRSGEGMRFMKLAAALSMAFSFVTLWAQSAPAVSSPNGRVQVSFSIRDAGPSGGQLVYNVSYRGKPLLVSSPLGMEIQGQKPLGPHVEILTSSAPSN